MEIGRAFGAPFKDPKWVGKAAIAVLCSLIPIVNIAVPGWGIAYVRNVGSGRENELPEWGDFGRHWVNGFAFGIASLVYYLPAILIVLVSGLPGAFAASIDQNGLGGLGTAIGGIMTGLILALLFVIAVSVFAQAARVNFAMGDGIGAAFDVKGIIACVRQNAGTYFTVWFIGIVAIWGLYGVGIVISAVLNSIPCVGQIVGLLALPLMLGFGLMVGMGINGLWGQYAQVAYAGAAAPSLYQPYPAPAASVTPGFMPQAAPPHNDDIDFAVAEAPVFPSVEPAGAAASLSGKEAVAAAVARLATPLPRQTAAAETPWPAGDHDDSSNAPEDARKAAVAAALFGGTAEDVSGQSPPSAEPVVEAVEQTAVPEAPQLTGGSEEESVRSTQELPSIPTRTDLREQSVLETAQEPQAETHPPMSAEGQPTEVEAQEAVSDAASDRSLPMTEDVIEVRETASTEPADTPVAPPPERLAVTATEAVEADSVPINSSPTTTLEPAVLGETVIDRNVRWRLRTVSDGAGQHAEWRLPSASVRIGRDDDCFIAIQDGKASRVHASIEARPFAVIVADLGSSNGTFVNGQRVESGSVEIRPGDELRVGDTVFVLDADLA